VLDDGPLAAAKRGVAEHVAHEGPVARVEVVEVGLAVDLEIGAADEAAAKKAADEAAAAALAKQSAPPVASVVRGTPPDPAKLVPKREDSTEKKICWLLMPKRRPTHTPNRKNHASILTPL
jgi:hypothetical protein